MIGQSSKYNGGGGDSSNAGRKSGRFGGSKSSSNRKVRYQQTVDRNNNVNASKNKMGSGGGNYSDDEREFRSRSFRSPTPKRYWENKSPEPMNGGYNRKFGPSKEEPKGRYQRNDVDMNAFKRSSNAPRMNGIRSPKGYEDDHCKPSREQNDLEMMKLKRVIDMEVKNKTMGPPKRGGLVEKRDGYDNYKKMPQERSNRGKYLDYDEDSKKYNKSRKSPESMNSRVDAISPGDSGLPRSLSDDDDDIFHDVNDSFTEDDKLDDTLPSITAEEASTEPSEIPDENTQRRIVQHIEYYFSDNNLVKDAFMMKHVRRNKEGFVNLKLISSFKKIRALTRDWRVVKLCLKNSMVLQLNELGTKVRRIQPLPQCLESRPCRSVLAMCLPMDNPTVLNVAEIFSKVGDIDSVKILNPGDSVPSDIRHLSSKYREISNAPCALVDFKSEENAKRAIQELGGDAETEWKGMIIVEVSPTKKSSSPILSTRISTPNDENCRPNSLDRKRRSRRSSPVMRSMTSSSSIAIPQRPNFRGSNPMYGSSGSSGGGMGRISPFDNCYSSDESPGIRRRCLTQADNNVPILMPPMSSNSGPRPMRRVPYSSECPPGFDPRRTPPMDYGPNRRNSQVLLAFDPKLRPCVCPHPGPEGFGPGFRPGMEFDGCMHPMSRYGMGLPMRPRSFFMPQMPDMAGPPFGGPRYMFPHYNNPEYMARSKGFPGDGGPGGFAHPPMWGMKRAAPPKDGFLSLPSSNLSATATPFSCPSTSAPTGEGVPSAPVEGEVSDNASSSSDEGTGSTRTKKAAGRNPLWRPLNLDTLFAPRGPDPSKNFMAHPMAIGKPLKPRPNE